MRDERLDASGGAAAQARGGLGKLLGRNLRAMGISQVVGKVAGFAVFVVLARYLRDVDLGRYAVAIALVSLFGVLIEFGTSNYLVREGAQRPEDLGGIIGHVLLIRTILGLVVLAAVVPVGLALGYDRVTLLALLIFTLASALRMAGAVFLSSLQALEHLGDVAAVQAQMSVLQAVVVGVSAALGLGLVGISWAILAASAVVPVYSWVRLRRRWQGEVRMRFRGLPATFKVARAFAAAAAMFTALTYLDTVMIQAFKGDAATGYYGVAYRVLLALGFVPTIYNEAVLRSISYLAKEDRAQMTKLFSRALRHLVIFAMPLAIGGAVLARPILMFVFGARYLPATTALAVLLASLIVAFPGWISVTTAYAIHGERAVTWMLALVLVSNVGVNFWVIPRWGIDGAAATTLLAELMFFSLLVALLHREGIRAGIVRAYARPVTAGIAMFGIVWPLRHQPLWLPLLAGAVVYLAGLFALHGFEREDRAFLRGMFSRAAPPVGVTIES